MAVQQYCLRWNNHQPNFISMFANLLNSESLVDVTLAAEGKYLQAHKVVLSACSSYFQSLFTLNPCQHPIVILKDVKYADLKVMVDFIYCGEVNVSQEQLPAILKTAETLKVKGLAETPEQNISLSKSLSVSSDKSCDSPSIRRKRLRKSSTGSGSGSGSTDHTGTVTGGSEETVGSIEIHTIKSELHQEPSTESELGSQESVDDESQQGMEEKSEEHPPEVSHQSPSPSPTEQAPTVGSKRGRLLIRQNRIKKESEIDEIGPSSRITERQSSEPPTSQLLTNRLTVPQPAYLLKQHSSPQLPTVQVHLVNPEATPSIKVRTEELRRASSSPQTLMSTSAEGPRSCHCPVLRPGPALGCNYCWNTFDNQGRVLRRKTKYHCPECQTNLCIVPCFQEYHERQGSGLTESAPTPGPVVPTIVKTSSMS